MSKTMLNTEKNEHTVERNKKLKKPCPLSPKGCAEEEESESIEDFCCPGTTCESWLCPHCRRPLEVSSVPPPPQTIPKPRRQVYVAENFLTDSSRIRTKSQSRTNVNKQLFNTNAKSTATKSIDPRHMARERGNRPANVTPIKRGYPDRPKATSAKRRGSSERRRILADRARGIQGQSLPPRTPHSTKKYAVITIPSPIRPGSSEKAKRHSKQRRPTPKK
ncbi:hypothetical protein Y032_0365g3577 [Ancylostoma ceylanicum]|uniref:Uncharacterized protein n=1 Tax=Ancylostoma ceylanicum TaxID=53326 RepID=A0A016RVN7_9BILA|nr:hypothetical protein Y032_0365g3577 [Ancylostoma ceylanicum]